MNSTFLIHQLLPGSRYLVPGSDPVRDGDGQGPLVRADSPRAAEEGTRGTLDVPSEAATNEAAEASAQSDAG